MRLTSPVEGTVQQLAVHTLGGVVEPAQPIMVIVPKGSQLVVEAKVPNKDAGFVKVRQPVRVKVDAFPFTDYGTIDGTLIGLSSDAIEDEKLGLYYLARVRLAKSAINNGSRSTPLTPGMAVSAEIKTGRRRIIQYLLSPITTRIDEAGRER
jgi:hemolysin D